MSEREGKLHSRNKQQPKQPTVKSRDTASVPSSVVRLQSVIGNQAVQRLLIQTKPADRPPAANHIRLSASAPTIQRYEGGEHMFLGDEGYAAAMAAYVAERLEGVPDDERDALRERLENGIGARMNRGDGTEMSYGAGIGLGGDHYGTPEAMFDDEGGWVNNTDVADIISIFEAEQEGVEAGNIGENYVHDDTRLVWNSENYLDLAKRNQAHFVGHNLKSYIDNHQKAVNHALDAYNANDDAVRETSWNRARFANAFADHFLTDSFSSGHMRVPREEIMNFFLTLDFNEGESGLMAKILHDYDNENGLFVRNARGDFWKAFGDKMLHADMDPDRQEAYTVKVMDESGEMKQTDKTGKDIAVEAVQMSVTEIIRAYQEGEAPGTFGALNLIPYIDPERQSENIEDVFNVSMNDDDRVKELEKLEWTTRQLGGVGEDEVDILVRNLPRLMREFNENMRERFKSDEGLQQVPAELREGILSLGSEGPSAEQDVQSIEEILRKESYLNEDEQLEIIALLRGNSAAARELEPELLHTLHSRFDDKTYPQLLNALKPLYRSWSTEEKLTEIRYHLGGRTNERAEQTIIAVLEAMNLSEWGDILKDEDLLNWLKRDLTGANDDRFNDLLKKAEQWHRMGDYPAETGDTRYA